MEFYRCNHCGNIVTLLHNSGAPLSCCGEHMEKIPENTVDVSAEKHVPVIKQTGNNVVVKIGSIQHPMEPKHYIMWIILETKTGYQLKHLRAGEAPEAIFELTADDEVVKAYEYCNIHGLWSVAL